MSTYKFSIGELARHLGMSSQGLHWYESKGLITPDRINSYRSYSVEDFCLLSRMRFYHQIGFGIEDINDLISMDLPDIAEKLESHVEARKKELEKEQAKLSIIEERAELTRNIESMIGTYKVVDLEPFYFKRSVLAKSFSDLDDGAPVKKWVEDIPIAQYVSIYEFRLDDAVNSHIGIMLPESCLPYADEQIQEEIASGAVPLYPRRKALYGVSEATENGEVLAYEELMSQYDESIFEGSIIRRPITCRRVNDETYAYWEVWAPIVREP